MATGRNRVDIIIGAQDRASGVVGNVRRELGSLQQAGAQTRRHFAQVRAASDLAAMALGGLAASAGAAGLAAVRLAGQLEQAEIAFETLLGSGEAAKAFLDDLADFAARTPFDFKGIQDASRLLLAFGFQAEAVLPIVGALGDATAALGGSTAELEGVVRALGQIQTKGRVSTEELLQLAERGIPVFQILQEKLGLTGEQLGNIGQLGIDAATGITAILEGLSERFGGAMERQSRTLLGLWSSVLDNVSLITTEIGVKITEAFDIKGALDTALAQLDRLREWVRDFDLREFLAANEEAVMQLAGALAGVLLPSLINVARVALLFARRTIVPLAALAAAGALVVDVARKLGVEFDNLALPTGGLARVAAVVSGLVEIFDGVTTSIAALIRATSEGVRDWAEFFGLVVGQIGRLLQHLNAMAAKSAEIQDVLVRRGPLGLGEAARLAEELGGLVRSIPGINLADAWREAFQGTDEAILDMFDQANASLRRGWERISDGIRGDVDQVTLTVVGGIADAVGDAAAQIVDWAALLEDDAEPALESVSVKAEDTADRVRAAGERIESEAVPVWQRALAAVGAAAAGAIRDALGLDQPESPLVQLGRDVVGAIVEGFLAAWPEAADRMAAAIDAVRWRGDLQRHLRSGAPLREPGLEPLPPDAGPAPLGPPRLPLGLPPALFDLITSGSLLREPGVAPPGVAPDLIGPGFIADFEAARDEFLDSLDELSRQLGRRAQREREAAEAAARAALFASAAERHAGTGAAILHGTSADAAGRAAHVSELERQAEIALDTVLAVAAGVAEGTQPISELGRAIEMLAEVSGMSAREIAEATGLVVRTQLDPGAHAEVPEPVPLVPPPVTGEVEPDRSELPDETRRELLERERAERQESVDALTLMSTEQGALANFGAALLSVAQQQVPAFGAALEGFVQAGAVGAVIAALVQLASESEAFGQLIEMVNAALEPLSAALGAVLEALLPVIQPMLELVAAVAQVAQVVARILAPPLLLLGRVISFVVDAFVAVWNFLLGWIPGLRIERPDLTPREPEPERERPQHSDQPPAAPEVRLGNLAPALQLGLATPLREAADVMLEAATMQLEAARASGGGPIGAASFAAGVDRFGQHIDRFGAYIDRLVTEGIAVHAPTALRVFAGITPSAFVRTAVYR